MFEPEMWEFYKYFAGGRPLTDSDLEGAARAVEKWRAKRKAVRYIGTDGKEVSLTFPEFAAKIEEAVANLPE